MNQNEYIYKEPFKFKSGLILKNRILMAPMTTRMSLQDGDVSKNELDYYSLRSGDIGAVITAAANVQGNGKGWEGEVSAESDLHIPSLKSLAKAIQIDGTKAIIQLFHGGRMTDSTILRGQQPVSASEIPSERENAEVPRALSEEEILELVENFKKAVIRSYKAGFDGVELHGANTYLLQQFFSPHSNRREDKWGGNLNNRYRFIELLVDEVLEIRDGFERPFAIGYRFSPEEYETPGISLEDSLYLVDKLADKNLDYLHISLTDYDRVSVSEDYQEYPIIKYIHDKINDRVPLIGVGGIKNKKDINNVLKNSELIALGRTLLSEPKWVSKIFNDQEDQIRLSIPRKELTNLELTRGLTHILSGMIID